MKKNYILLPIAFLSFLLGLSFASAANARHVASILGDPLTVITIDDISYDGVIYDSKENEIKKQSIKTTTLNNKEYKERTKKDDDISLRNDMHSNFSVDADIERLHESTTTDIEVYAVHSSEDLRSYIQSIIIKNKDITFLTTEDDRVILTRDIPTKLLGLIPVISKETITVISWGDGTQQVVVARPWWNFFSKDLFNGNDISNDLETRIKSIPSGEFIAIMHVVQQRRPSSLR